MENVLGYVCNPSSSKERDAASKRRLGNATSVTVLWTHVKTPTDGRDVTGGWRNRPGSIKARAVEPASASGMKQPLAGMPEVWPRDAASRSSRNWGYIRNLDVPLQELELRPKDA